MRSSLIRRASITIFTTVSLLDHLNIFEANIFKSVENMHLNALI